MCRRMVRGHARSGLSIRAYCAEHRVKEPAFYWWRRELARRDVARAPAPTPHATFVPVVVAPSQMAERFEGVTIELRGGRMLRLPAMAMSQLAELASALEADMKVGAS